jgi:hypothetical protein
MKNNNVLRRVLMAVLFLALAGSSAQPQVSAATKDRITLAHKFMRALYPDLGGSRTLTVETYIPYAQEDVTISWLEVSIGEGPNDAILGYAGGCINQPPTMALPPPPELGPPDSPTAPSNISLSKATNEKTKDCPSGAIRSKQFLAGSFWIGNEGRLTAYVVQSPRDLDKMNAFAGVVLSHPEMSDEEVAVALKKAGATFGPMDKDEFVKSLPLGALEPFLGKLQVLEVGFSPLQKNRNNVATWPDWRVKTKATRDNGTEETYELNFDQFRGDLISLRLVVPGQLGANKP